MSYVAKRYRIEQDLGQGFGPHTALAGEGGAPSEQIGEILSAVQELKTFLDPAYRMANDVVEAYRREIAEVYKLRTELDAMKEAITSTKLEIATLHRSEHEGKGMRRVAGELDAVVGATEEATTTILAATEDIEMHASMLKAAGVETGNNDHVGAILDRVVVLYESCNFQDLTGQRITKIVGVLKFVEERLDRMIEVWGGLDALKDIADQQAMAIEPADDDSALLNGPRLEGDEGHVSQNDIDALFD